MLFHAAEFLFLFLPITLVGFFAFGRMHNKLWPIAWLVGASLFFYAWWNVALLPLLVGSITLNYLIGTALIRQPRRWLLIAGVGFNLAAIGFFKYAGFFVEVFNVLSAASLPVPQILLPLAISFYTFQQIAYLVDCHDGRIKQPDFLRYCLFIVFFPQLIAGPIVHFREIMPQIDRPATFLIDKRKFALGFTVFAIGLFKKIVLADTLAPIAQPAFDLAAQGLVPGFAFAWQAVIAFALQLYFDFSGYSDMAVGLALMFGILLPFNFASPYKAANIIEFWARWHITLTRFLTAYVYNPITTALMRRRMRAGRPIYNRAKPSVVPFAVLLAAPTLITMGLAGLWHGAGWQFIAFGLIHGALLVLNHAWHATPPGRARPGRIVRAILLPVQVVATFLMVAVSLVFFKAVSLEQALLIVAALAGAGDAGPRLYYAETLIVLTGLAVVWGLPNTQQWVGLAERSSRQAVTGARAWLEQLGWSPRPVHGFVVGAVLSIALLRNFGAAPAEFLYFAF